MRDFHRWLRDGIAHCMYIEDVQAFAHFVFHPRLNGYSNVCLLCQHGTDGDDSELGHATDCPYPSAVRRLRTQETLAAVIEKA